MTAATDRGHGSRHRQRESLSSLKPSQKDSRFQSGILYEIPWGQHSAAIVIATLPLVALVLLFDRWIVSGLTRGAVND